MIILNSIGFYEILLLATLVLISMQSNTNVKPMLWFFLVGFNITFFYSIIMYFKQYSFYYFQLTLVDKLCNQLLMVTKMFFVNSVNSWKIEILISSSFWFNNYNLDIMVVLNSFIIIYSLIFLVYSLFYAGMLELISLPTSQTLNWEGLSHLLSYNTAPSSLLYLTPLQHLLIILLLFLTPLSLFSNWNDLKYKFFSIKQFLILIGVINCLILLSFSTFNLFFFIVLFESITLPLFLLISLFGHQSKRYRAAWYLFIYTLIGSIFLLTAIILIYYEYQTTNFFEILTNSIFTDISTDKNNLIFLCLFLGFAVKVPILPFHMWLPEAHVEAPTAGSILLAGIILKLSGYAFIVFVLPLFNNLKFLPLIYTLTSISMIYSCILLFRETHLKKIIAYSSIIHMNLSILGLFGSTIGSLLGGAFMLFSHGFISSGLFFCSGIIYNRFKSYDITVIKNLTQHMPNFSFFFLILIFGNIGLPLTSGFIGEFLVIFGLSQVNWILLILVLLVLFLNTVYNILLVARILYGNVFSINLKINNNKNVIYFQKWHTIVKQNDLTRIETVSLFIFSFYNIYFGIFPQLILENLCKDTFLMIL